MSNRTKNTITFLFSLFFCFVILEVFLRTYKPFPMRLKGDKIFLPVNQKYIFENTRIDKLDKEIVHTKNSLGFRGGEPPKNFDDYLSIIVVGGSSTECFYLSDDKTWPYLLEQKLKKSYNNVWLNNAGLDGHSIFGHIILLEDYLTKLKPKIILFLISANEIGRTDISKYDKYSLRDKYFSWKNFIKKNSEVVCLLVNIGRSLNAQKRQINHGDIDITKLDILVIPEKTRKTEIQKHKSKYLESYKKRLLQLVDISKNAGIEPIFVTQPTLYADKVDSLTGVDLGALKLCDSINGKLFWEILELYNNIVKEVGKITNTFVIDLANKLPKNSLYFYDSFHFTNEGAEKVSEILYVELKKHLSKKYKTLISDPS